MQRLTVMRIYEYSDYNGKYLDVSHGDSSNSSENNTDILDNLNQYEYLLQYIKKH